MKKAVVYIIIIIMIFAFSACKQNEHPAVTRETTQQSTTTVAEASNNIGSSDYSTITAIPTLSAEASLTQSAQTTVSPSEQTASNTTTTSTPVSTTTTENTTTSETTSTTTPDIKPTDTKVYSVKQSSLDYAYGYWSKGVDHLMGIDEHFYIRTGYYGISLDTETGKIDRMGAFTKTKTEIEAALADDTDIENLPSIQMDYSVTIAGTEHKYSGLTPVNSWGEDATLRMAETGKFMQHFEMIKLKFANTAVSGNMEISCLGNYFAMSFGVWPQTNSTNAVLKYSLTLNSQFNKVTWKKDKSAVTVTNASGQGYTFVSMNGSELSLSGTTLQITKKISFLKANQYNVVNVAVIPSVKASISDASTVQGLVNDINISVINVATNKNVTDKLDKNTGVHEINMNNVPLEGIIQVETVEQEGSLQERAYNDTYINLRIEVTNNSDTSLKVPIRLYKQDYSYNTIFCVSPVIRDSLTGEPIGLPVQASINFHGGFEMDDPVKDYLSGQWMKYYTLVEVPAGKTLIFDFTGTMSRWGGLPAVTHQQISLIGWGGYQQWEHVYSAAGGSLCYDMVRSWNGANFADAYPQYVTMTKSNGEDVLHFNGDNNVGGGDFLFYTKNGIRTDMAQVKTRYRLNGPNLTETIYTGYTSDFKVKLEMTAYFARDNAVAHFIHSFKYTFLEDVNFDRMVFYSCGADSYTYSWWTKMAVGNADGLVNFSIDNKNYNGVFDVPAKGTTAYVGNSNTMQRLDIGDNMWTAMMGTARNEGYSNRVMTVHSYNAKINGVNYTKPTLSILSTTVNGDSCISEITPPKAAGNVIKAGSVVEGTIGYILLPGAKSEYGGDSKIMLGFDDSYYDTWEMAHKFATQSGTTVTATKGQVIRNFPAAVKSTGVTNGVAAQFTIKKGIGYVPISIKNLPDYKGWSLQKKVNGSWKTVDQSKQGNDFWQCYYDPDTKSYELIFNVEHNGNNDSAEYRLIKG